MPIWITLVFTIIGVLAGGIITLLIAWYEQKRLLRMLPEVVHSRQRVSLNEEFLLTGILAEKIRKANKVPDVIIAVCPGGAMIAEWLSRGELGDYCKPIPVLTLPMYPKKSKIGGTIKTIFIHRYTNIDIEQYFKDPNVLLVNDIARTGATLQSAYDHLKKNLTKGNIFTATLFCHRDANVKPNFYVVKTDNVIRFEWKGETIKD